MAAAMLLSLAPGPRPPLRVRLGVSTAARSLASYTIVQAGRARRASLSAAAPAPRPPAAPGQGRHGHGYPHIPYLLLIQVGLSPALGSRRKNTGVNLK